MQKLLTPIKAHRERCRECTGGVLASIRRCPKSTCSSWLYRMGRRPDRLTSEAYRTQEPGMIQASIENICENWRHRPSARIDSETKNHKLAKDSEKKISSPCLSTGTGEIVR